MIVDSSALLAVILLEEDEDIIINAMVDAERLHMSAANWLEAAIVVDQHRSPRAAIRFEELMEELSIEIVPVAAEIAVRARVAHQNFGRGNHPAKLNYGDCFSYALAKTQREPLLFKGQDFTQTDVLSALKA